MDNTTNAVSRLQQKLDELIVESLKKHGYEFKTRADLAAFIKDKCQAITKGYNPYRTTVYYAEGVAFLYYKEEPSFKVDGLTATASLGSYAFIPKDLKDAKKKRCPKCEEVKDLIEFGKDSSKKDGLKVHCKTCRSKAYKEYYYKDLDKTREGKRATYYRTKEKEFNNLINT